MSSGKSDKSNDVNLHGDMSIHSPTPINFQQEPMPQLRRYNRRESQSRKNAGHPVVGVRKRRFMQDKDE